MLAAADVEEARTRVFQAALTQAEELWVAASASGAASRPLPLFYCLSQAGRAMCAAWTDVVGHWQPKSHGLTSADPAGGDVASLRVSVSRSRLGMFPMVAAATDSNVFSGSTTVAQLWASLPDLPRAPTITRDASRPVYLEATTVPGVEQGFLDYLAPKYARLSFPWPPEIVAAIGEPGEAPSIDDVMAALERYPRARGVRAEARKVYGMFGEEETIVLTFPNPDGELRPLSDVGDAEPRRTGLAGGGRERYVVRPQIGTGQAAPPSQLMTLWALMYGLSQLARYHPDEWVSALNPDRSPSAVDLEHVLDAGLELVPELLVPAITNGIMPRLVRERLAAERAAGAGNVPPP